MLPEQTIQDLNELHEERVDLIIQYKNVENQRLALDTKEGWLLICSFIGIPLLAVIAGISSSLPFIYRPIEQQIFWIVGVLGAIIWSTMFWRRRRKEELENMRQRQELDRRLEQLENRLRGFNPPLKKLRENGWWLFTR
jgi:hypothetical protein